MVLFKLKRRTGDLLVSMLLLFLLPGCEKLSSQEIIINAQPIKVELAQTPQEQYQGLSGRQDLCDNCGMLFIFEQPSRPQFVMRQMKFALDIIWISAGRIVDINQAAQPENPVVASYQPSTSVDRVLEVKAGTAKKYGWQTGMAVTSP